MTTRSMIILLGLMSLSALNPPALASESRDQIRAREAGIRIGVLPTGELNAITDVAGVRVGHLTLREGKGVRTGVTAILPHNKNIYQSKLPAGFAQGNGFGKMAGSTQIIELGEIETPVLLTNTLSVAESIAALVEWTLVQPGNEQVRSVNAVVGETNDGYLNDIRGRYVTKAHALQAIENAQDGVVAEGAVGAGTGTKAFGFKAGIGTSSRRLPRTLGGYTVGVLVQSNYGGVLSVDGVRIGELLDQYYLQDVVDNGDADGSIMIVVATDAPLSDRNLRRLAYRSFIGVGRTGSPMSNGSGDYAIAFSTADSVRRTVSRRSSAATVSELPNDLMSPLFQAVTEATEEAILNSLFMAVDTVGHRGEIKALPTEKVLRLYRENRKGVAPKIDVF